MKGVGERKSHRRRHPSHTMEKSWDSSLSVLNMLARCVCRVLFCLCDWSPFQWIATAASTYLAQAIVANSSEHYSLSQLLDHFVCRVSHCSCGPNFFQRIFISFPCPIRMVMNIPGNQIDIGTRIVKSLDPIRNVLDWIWIGSALSGRVYFIARLYLYCLEIGQAACS